MFALIAALIWFLAAFHVGLGTIDMLLLGLGFLALHFAFGPVITMPTLRRE